MLEVNFTELWNTLTSGRIFDAVSALWAGVLDAWFIVFLYIILLAPVYFKTKSIVPPAVLSMLLSSIFLALLPPQAHMIVYMMIVFAVAAVLYRLFTR